MKLLKKTNALFFLVILSSSIYSQNFKEKTDSSKGFVYTYIEGVDFNYRKYVLKNGLTVLMSVNIEKPRIYTCIAVKSGSNDDSKNATGLAHYLEHMLFKGTDKFGTTDYNTEKIYLDKIDDLYEKYNQIKDENKRKAIYKQIDSISGLAAKYSIANEYDKMYQSIGAQGTNAFTSFEETVYLNDIPANQIDAWLQIESERFRNPVLRLFHTELEAVYEEKNISLDDEDEKVDDALYADLFRNHNYGLQTTIGKTEHLKNPSLKSIREFYKKNYVPNNMAIVLSGFFDPDETIVKIDKAFGYMIPKELEKNKYGTEKIKEKINPLIVYGQESESVTIGYRLPGIQDKENYKTLLLSEVLDNSVSGLININLNNKFKVLEANAYLDQNKDYSVLILTGKPNKNQTLEEVKNLLMSQIDSIKFGKIDDKIISSVGFNESVNNERIFSNNVSTAYELLNTFTKEIDVKKKLEDPNLMMKTSKLDLSLYSKRMFTNNYSIVYKKQGIDTASNKIVKPEINSVELNRNKTSHFAKDILDNEIEIGKPVFIDFVNDIKKDSIQTNCELLYSKNKKNKLFSLTYVFEFGNFADNELPIAFKLLKISGTQKQSAEKMAREFYNLGCSFNIYTGNEQMYIQLKGIDSTFQRASSTLDYLIQNVNIEKSALKNLVNSTIQQNNEAKSDKYKIQEALNNFVKFGKENPTTTQLSSKKLKRIKVENIENKLKTIFAYNHKVLYDGPREESEVVSVIRKNHTIPQVKLIEPQNRIFAPVKYNTPQVFFTNYDMVQAEIYWYADGSPYEVNKVPIVNLFNEYYDGGMGSIVFQTIRESKALAYSTFLAYKNPTSNNNNGIFSAYIGTQADKLDSAIVSMNSLINDLQFSESLFENTKKSIIGQVASNRILSEQKLFYYLRSKRLNNNYDIRKDVFSKTAQLSFSDLQNFHNNEIKSKTKAILIVGSKKKIDLKELNRFGEVHEIKTKDLFSR
jgi:predicted Zn-dependent peptidase